MKLLAALFTSILATGASCNREAPTSRGVSSAQETIDVKAVASDPEKFVGREVTLKGTLSNSGTNYFTDLTVVLTGEDESFVYVQPWLPTSVPPSLPGTRPRDTLSKFLDKKVELEGTLRHDQLKQLGRVHYLEVTSARILEDNP